jgi:hypothetical protein
MFRKCANPDCAKPFAYRKGRLFRFHESHPMGEKPTGTHSVRHFWLCELCSRSHTLEYRKGQCVLIDKGKNPVKSCLKSSATA